MDIAASGADKIAHNRKMLKLTQVSGNDFFGTIEAYGDGEYSFQSASTSCLVNRKRLYPSESAPLGYGSVITIRQNDSKDFIALILTESKLGDTGNLSPTTYFKDKTPKTFFADGLEENDWKGLNSGAFSKYWICAGDSIFYSKVTDKGVLWTSWTANSQYSANPIITTSSCDTSAKRGTVKLPRADTRQVIEGISLRRRFGFERYPIFDEVTFALPVGGMYAVTGPSGCGKSTLMKMIEMGGRAAKGSLTKSPRYRYAFGFNGTLFLPDDFSGAVSSAPQDTETLHADMTVSQELEYYAKLHKRSNPRAAAEKVASELNLSNVLGNSVSHLSGGQLKRLNAAIALLSEPELLFFDEPDSGLDAVTAREFYTLVKQRVIDADGRLTVLCITHSFDCEDLFDGAILMGASPEARKTKAGPGICYVGPFGRDLKSFFGIPDSATDWKKQLLEKLADNPYYYKQKYTQSVLGD